MYKNFSSIGACWKINYIFDPCDPYMTFEVKLLITYVPTYLLIILTKFRQNPMKHVEE